MALFRLLHASDLHIAQTPTWVVPASPRWLAPMTRTLRLASHDEEVLHRPAAKVPDPANPGQARMYCLEAHGDPTLQFWFSLLALLAGNHDRYRSAFTLYLPGSEVFDATFDSIAVGTRQHVLRSRPGQPFSSLANGHHHPVLTSRRDASRSAPPASSPLSFFTKRLYTNTVVPHRRLRPLYP
jgi:hypothetical protein